MLVPDPFTTYSRVAVQQMRSFDPERKSIEDWALLERLFVRFAAYRDTLVSRDFHLTAKREGLDGSPPSPHSIDPQQRDKAERD